MEGPILSVEELTKSFGGLLAVNSLTFDVKEHEALGLMGPNGAGKTTVFNLIYGVYPPTSGKVVFKNGTINGMPSHKVCRLGIARTHQIPRPFSTMDVRTNLMVAAKYGRGLGGDAAEKVVDEVLAFTGLTEKKDTVAWNLALLDLKRLELARALATKPELVLLDEIAGGLTEEEIPELMKILRTLRQTGLTIVLIEHVMTVLLKAVERVVVLNEGKKLFEGGPDEVLKTQSVVEAYFGS
ncbi:MAG TPA: ABC transporter ATP-binding protein [Nitrososphaerales archaeon]|nr:ABC transporter ATP-binding protein [Nitrososphaerales archaeon]